MGLRKHFTSEFIGRGRGQGSSEHSPRFISALA
jgi:hypothetical protein